MKARKLTVRPLRKFCPILPANIIHGETVLLLRTDATGKGVERQLFTNHNAGARTMVPGFTHYVRLPFYL